MKILDSNFWFPFTCTDILEYVCTYTHRGKGGEWREREYTLSALIMGRCKVGLITTNLAEVTWSYLFMFYMPLPSY